MLRTGSGYVGELNDCGSISGFECCSLQPDILPVFWALTFEVQYIYDNIRMDMTTIVQYHKSQALAKQSLYFKNFTTLEVFKDNMNET